MRNFFEPSKDKKDEPGVSQDVLVKIEDLINVKYPFQGEESERMAWADAVVQLLKENPKATEVFFNDFPKKWGSVQFSDPEMVKNVLEDLSLVTIKLAKLANNADRE